MFNSTTFSSSRRKLQCANPSGAGEQVRAINFASAAPSKIRGRAEFGLYLRVSAAAIPSSTSRRRVRPILLMLVSNAAEIALSLQPSPASDTSAFNRMRAFVSDCAGCLPAQIIASSRSRSSALNFTTYFLTEISLPATNHLHRRIAATEIQKNTADSMTLVTSMSGAEACSFCRNRGFSSLSSGLPCRGYAHARRFPNPGQARRMCSSNRSALIKGSGTKSSISIRRLSGRSGDEATKASLPVSGIARCLRSR